MLPVSVLPVAGLLLGVGSSHLRFVPELVATIMASAGDSILANLPLLFALGVALGLCDFEGVAAVAAVVGYFVMLASLGCLAAAQHHKLVSVLGIETLQTGVFGGILVGMVAAAAYRRFYRLELPPYLGFFAGKRSVPIITGVASLLLGALLSLLWPPAQHIIEAVADRVANDNPAISAGLWAVVNRALIPFGLHHIWNNPFFFLIGSYPDPAGGVARHGDIYRFLAGDKSAGILGGGYLFSLFGLPAACLAMWRNARPARRKEAGGLLASAALTSILTGITEPVEFAFLFVAPGLYVAHAFFAGLACWLMVALGGHLGITFSFGLIDYFVLFPLHTRAWLVWVLGPFFGLAYYGVFDWAIRHYNLATIGRESPDPWKVVGGRDNVRHGEWCGPTRLRLQVENAGLIQDDSPGIRGVQKLGDGVVHLLVGPEFERQGLDLSQ